MFSVTVSDHFMVAHSLPHPAFGPAQQLHGVTYEVHWTLSREKCNSLNIVIDIGLAQQWLKQVCSEFAYKNLDAEPKYQSMLTTSEFIAHEVWTKLAALCKSEFSGKMKVELRETPLASVAFEGFV